MSCGAIVLIGQIASGKTTVAQLLRLDFGALLASSEQFGDSAPSKGQQLAETLCQMAGGRPLIYECSGAASDFEELIDGLRRHVTHVYVIKLHAPLDVALARLRQRQWQPPRAGGPWHPQLQFTARRLRTVPADLTLDTTDLSPRNVADAIAAFITSHSAQSTWPGRAPGGIYSFSRLATFERCPLAFRFRYIDKTPKQFLAQETILGQALHQTLAWLYHPDRSNVRVEFEELVAIYDQALLLCVQPDNPLEAALFSRGRALLHSHYTRDYCFDTRCSVGVEVEVSFELRPDVLFVGQIDRVARTQAGTLALIDYKSGSSPLTYFSGAPDLLQIEAYGVGALLEYGTSGVESCRHDLQSGQEDVLAIVPSDVDRIRIALGRWIDRVESDRSWEARPGKHCRWCPYYPSCPSRMGEPSPGIWLESKSNAF